MWHIRAFGYTGCVYIPGHHTRKLQWDDMHPQVRQYLDSSKETEKLKGVKWLLAMMSKGRDVSEFFPDVVKNVVVKSVEVKKMVYMYLVHYAVRISFVYLETLTNQLRVQDFDTQCREIALLSVNSFQKDLAATNQLIRGVLRYLI
jgi:AP-3 complex subunit beta